MTRIINTIVFLFFISSPAFAQWEIQNPKVFKNFESIFFVNEQYGWVAGEDGSILKTTDEGENWELVYSESDLILNDIFFIDSLVGWVAGNSGKIFKSTDGGSSWIHLNSGASSNLTSIYFSNDSVGYCCGGVSLLKTTDGGLNWFSIYSGYVFYDISFVNDENGYVSCNQSTFLKTTDAGFTWTPVHVNASNASVIFSIQFLNDSVGFVALYNFNQDQYKLLKTTDASNNWQTIFTGDIYSVFFNDINHGWIAKDFGVTFRTTDGGLTWMSSIAPVVYSSLTDVYFINNYVGFTVGTEGIIMKTTTQGADWKSKNSATSEYLTSVYFLDENKGWAIGNNIIASTNNGGMDWSINIDTLSVNFRDMAFIDENKGFVVGWSYDDNFILQTSDGGNNWEISNNLGSTNLYPNQIIFISDSVGFISSSPGLYKTSDQGNSWIDISPGEYFNDLFFLNSLNGWAGKWLNQLLKTTDGGITWSSIANVGTIINSIYFLDDKVGWISGFSTIFKTTDGGVSWVYQQQPITYNALRSIYFIDEQYGWCVGDDGIILKTINGGDIWEFDDFPTDLSYTKLLSYNKDLWVVGESGIILHKNIEGIIPVDLTSFVATLKQNTITLNWQTATETNNSEFEIQKAPLNPPEGGKPADWQIIGFVPGFGTTAEPKSYSFVDENLTTGKYEYRLKQIDFDGSFEYSNTVEVEITSPTEFALEQNYPNPFNPSTSIQYTLGSRQFVRLKIFNSLGEEIETLVNEFQEAGVHSTLYFVNSTLPSGVYYYQLRAGEFIATKKFVLLK